AVPGKFAAHRPFFPHLLDGSYTQPVAGVCDSLRYVGAAGGGEVHSDDSRRRGADPIAFSLCLPSISPAAGLFWDTGFVAHGRGAWLFGIAAGGRTLAVAFGIRAALRGHLARCVAWAVFPECSLLPVAALS